MSATDSPAPAATAVGEEDRTVCFCHCVPISVLRATIEAGARTFEELQLQTACSTGCGGCEWDVRDVLTEELAKRSQTG